MISILLKSRLRFWQKYKQAPWKVFPDLMYTLMAVGNGILLGLAIKMQNDEALQGLNIEELTIGFYLLAFSISAIRLFFPVYQQWKDPFPKYYPLSFIKRVLSNHILDLTHPFFLFSALFLISIAVVSPEGSLSLTLNGVLMILTGHFSGRMIQVWIARRFNTLGSIYIGFALLIMTLWIVLYSGNVLPTYTGLIVLFMLILAQIQALRNSIDSRTYKVYRGHTKGFLYLKMLWKNPYARTPILISLGIKIFALAADMISFSRSGEHIFGNDSALTLWFIGNPLIWYTYIFNNSLGYWNKLWLINDLGSGRYSDMLRQHLRLLALPIAIDALITLPVLLSYWKDSTLILTYYFTSSLFLLCFSVFWSTYKPVRIAKTLQRVSTSQTGSMVGIFTMMALTIISLNVWLYLIALLCVIMAVIIFLTARSYYPESRHRIFKLIK